MKKLFLLVVFATISTLSIAQTYIKGNALYWAVGVINASVETRLSNQFTFNADAVFSPWNSVGGKPYLIGEFIPEVRFYPKKANSGFYVGIYATAHIFKISKWNYTSARYQKGWGYGFGATFGYELPIAERWLIDFYVGGGWQGSRYRGYYSATNEQYIGWNGSGEWIPYKIGVSFSYRLCKNAK